ncbi:MAG: hypothetical protein ABJH68_01900 [Ilumatobacter sp.]|uniref:type II secretion system F family protein n=1 Tax=Ilumatobacter sp. TaxID=1967498 RepID=UPI00329A3FAF
MNEQLGFALVAMAAMAGLVVAVAGWRGKALRISSRDHDRMSADQTLLRFALGASTCVVVLVVTRWPVAAAYGAASGFLFPTLASASRRRREAIERVEAIAVWTESLRDTMAASAGIQEALKLSARVAPAPIRTEVRDLSLRLQHQSVARSLRRFAADMHHPLSDMVVASLILATSQHAGSLQGVLATTAKGARDSSLMWRQIETSRTRTYSQSRLAGWISFLVILFLIIAQRDFLTPFDSAGGQVAMFFICGVFFLSGVMLYRLGRPGEPRRVFAGIERWSDHSTHDSQQVAR